jgi:uncharacterized damage-inducible protein DinB
MSSDVLPWLDYGWVFDFPAGMFRAILERLRGTPVRLDDALRDVHEPTLVARPAGKKWCAKEHAGHLWTVEALWQTRTEQYLHGAAELTAADMENRASERSAYESRPVESILAGFRAARAETLAMLDPLSLEDAGRIAHHPRLGRPMRLVDLCFFAAEHDDHHLAVVRELVRGSQNLRSP